MDGQPVDMQPRDGVAQSAGAGTQARRRSPQARGPAGEVMIFFKSCPRCSGDRSLEHDHYGWYVLCLSCGHVTYPDVVPDAKVASVERSDTTRPSPDAPPESDIGDQAPLVPAVSRG